MMAEGGDQILDFLLGRMRRVCREHRFLLGSIYNDGILYYRSRAMASVLGVSIAELHKMLRNGTGPDFLKYARKIPGHTGWIIPREKLAGWMHKNYVAAHVKGDLWCPTCEGSGITDFSIDYRNGGHISVVTCTTCGGKGYRKEEE